MPDIRIDRELCAACFRCTEVCPYRIFLKTDDEEPPLVDHEYACMSCGHCVAICPHGAILHDSYPPGSVLPVKEKLLPSYNEVLEMLRARRSARSFKDKPVKEKLAMKVIEAARFAPTAHNTQGTRYVLVDSRQCLEGLVDLTKRYVVTSLESLEEGQGAQRAREQVPGFDLVMGAMKSREDFVLFHAPLFIGFVGVEENYWADTDANLALQNATMAAMSLGLGSFYTGFVVMAARGTPEINELTGIRSGEKLCAGLAVGHPQRRYRNWVERKPADITWIDPRPA